MGDWIGLVFFILLFGGVILGLKILGRPVKSTEEEFERNASKSASLLTAGVQGIMGFLNPSAAKGKVAVMEVKEGRFLRNKREGKAQGKDHKEKID